MDTALDDTGVATISLLESRLNRVEHILYGTSNDISLSTLPAVQWLVQLERRLASLVLSVRVYADLLKIYRAHPSLFSSPPTYMPPTQLDADAVRATVLSYASAFPATASALSATVTDMPVPDASLSARLVSLAPRMEKVDASQRSLDAEIAELRCRSEALVRQFYEGRALASTKFVANVEARIERAEGRVRRLEKERDGAADGR